MNEKDVTERLWELLVSYITKKRVITSNEITFKPDFKDLLNTITKSLTFEDPGIFPEEIISLEEKEEQSNRYLWLLNELLFVVVHDKQKMFTVKNINLQKDLISSAFMKQPWWVNRAFKVYCDVISKLCSFDKVPPIGIEIVLSSKTSYQLKSIVFNYQTIKVCTEEASQELLDCCVQMVTHVVSLLTNIDDRLIPACTEQVFNVFVKKNIRLKYISLLYFNRLLKTVIEYTPEIKEINIRVIERISLIFNELSLCSESHEISERDIISLNNSVIKYLREIQQLQIEYDEQNVQRLVFCFFKILIVYFKFPDRLIVKQDLLNQVLESTKKYLSEMRNVSATNSAMITFLRFVETVPTLISLYDYNILSEVQTGHFDGNLYDHSSIWKYFSDLLKKRLDDLEKIKLTNELLDSLMVIQEILQVLNGFEFKFLKWHQNTHSKKMECFCNKFENANIDLDNTGVTYFYFNSNSLVEKFVSAISSRNDIDIELIVISMGIAYDFLHNSMIVKEMLQEQKMFLIALIISPFYKHFKEITSFQEIMSKLPNNIKYIFDKSELDEKLLRGMQTKSLDLLFHLSHSSLGQVFADFHMNLVNFILNQDNVDWKQSFVKYFMDILVLNSKNSLMYLNALLQLFNAKDINDIPMIITVIRDIICLCHKNCTVNYLVLEIRGSARIECLECSKISDSPDFLIDITKFQQLQPLDLKIEESFFQVENLDTKCELIKLMPNYLNHVAKNSVTIANMIMWTSLLNEDRSEVFMCLDKNITRILDKIEKQEMTNSEKQKLHQMFLEKLLKLLENSLSSEDFNNQSMTINIIFKFATIVKTEHVLLHCFRMMIYFMIYKTSAVSSKASWSTIEMCQKNNVMPLTLFHWYKEKILRNIVPICVDNYKYGISLYSTVNAFQKCLGFDRTSNFMALYYREFVAILLPFCVKDSKNIGLLNEINGMLQLDMPTTLSTSFLKIFPYVYINEDAETYNSCIDFILQNTGSSLLKLLEQNIKKTVAECLIYYHKSPDFVVRALENLTSKGEGTFKPSDASDYIAKKFLGVLAYFECVFLSNECEKNLKTEALLSLGSIIRLLGAQHITNFQFKIMAVLKTAYSVVDVNLKDICLQVWKIFIFTADVSTLGPILSTIFVSLEPFLENYAVEVNEIYKYLVVNNECLLSLHIPDLFFIENSFINSEIKMTVQAQIKRQKSNEKFQDKIQTFLKHINHEDSRVRIYGLRYFKKLLEQNRKELKDMIVGQIAINPLIEVMLNILMKNCKSENPKLQLCASEVLGEIGAIEPGLLPPNYATQKPIMSFSIHSDNFASMALQELCRAYQFQNNSKYIDAYSLGIQEVLKLRDVNPMEQKNMVVWDAVSERMRPFVIPLLTSTYTPISLSKVTAHPVFRKYTTSCIEWAFAWASKLIDKVTDGITKHFLECIKPSMKCELHTAALFLPYILIHSIESSGTNDIELIYEELQYIFKTIVQEEDVPDDEDDEVMVVEPEQQIEDKPIYYMKTINYVPIKSKKKSESVLEAAMKCAKMIFGIFDFLENYLRSIDGRSSQLYADIDNLLNKFDTKLLARVNFNCGEYARALIYLESYIRENPKERLQKEMVFLANIYAELGDSDSVEGIKYVKHSELSLAEQILINNVTGRLHESAACYERMLQIGNVSLEDVKNIVNCYVGLDQPETALMVSETVLKKIYNENFGDLLQEIQAEPLFRLGRFDELTELLKSSDSTKTESWGIKCGRLLLKFRSIDFDEFGGEVEKTRTSILKNLRASESEQGAYLKDYPDVIKIHLITEFEKAAECVNKVKENSSLEVATELIQELIDHWNDRLEYLQPIPTVVEPILCIRRILLVETKHILQRLVTPEKSRAINKILDNEIGKLWIQSTKYACKHNMFQQAYLYILNAESYKPNDLFIEKAKYFWQKGDQINSFKVLDRGLNEMVIANGCDAAQSTKIQLDRFSEDDRKLYAKGKLLVAKLNAEAGHVGFERNIQYFKEALEAHKECEKSNVLFAAYMDKKFNLTVYSDKHARELALLDIMHTYAKSMCYGCNFVYQSMPRFLTIWLDNTTTVRVDKQTKDNYDRMNKIADRLRSTIAPYFFFTAFSQIVSRIGHPNPDVYSVLKSIIIKIILSYSQQSLWMLLSIYKSSYPIRVRRCNEIFTDKRLNDPSIQRLIKDFNKLADKFIELTSKEIQNSSRIKVSHIVPDLPRFFRQDRLSNIVLPIQRNLQLVRDCSKRSFTFPNEFVYIHEIDEEIEQLKSLQRPRKIRIIGSDGKFYSMLLKHKDDLRKDFRFLEFCAVVREYLCKDSEARHRKLNMRTYSVIPLNEESGIIEWVPNLRTFKEIIMKQYKKCGTKIPSLLDLREMELEKKSVEFRKKKYLELVKLHHPVFDNWFREQFPNPHNYFQAKSAYIKSTAVMSMIGYVMGLGDRHGENILFDAASGDTVHVDFNCLFNRGEMLGVPEVVPFRLTNNMIHAMGPFGVEGLFRKCSEITLRVLQKEKNTLISFLRPFVYDPLLSWERSADSSTRDNSERTDSKATIYVSNIEQRLKGIVKKYKGSSNIPLSTEGQVNLLTEEATNVDNLSAMFYGWSSFM